MSKPIASAMVLAAGKGVRMRPLTDTIPKPMVKVGGISLIDRALDKLAATAIEKAVVNTHYLAEVLESHLEKRIASQSRPPLTISREEVLLETGGGIAKALPHLHQGAFYAINSDIMWIDSTVPALKRLADYWDEEEMDALLLIHPVEKSIGYDGQGDFLLTPEGRLQRPEGTDFPFVFTGVQILSPRLFTDIPSGPFSLNLLYGRNRQADGILPRIFGLVHDGAWLHIGTPEGVKLAEEFLEARSPKRN